MIRSKILLKGYFAHCEQSERKSSARRKAYLKLKMDEPKLLMSLNVSIKQTTWTMHNTQGCQKNYLVVFS